MRLARCDASSFALDRRLMLHRLDDREKVVLLDDPEKPVPMIDDRQASLLATAHHPGGTLNRRFGIDALHLGVHDLLDTDAVEVLALVGLALQLQVRQRAA